MEIVLLRSSGRSRPSDKGRGCGHPDAEIREGGGDGLQKNFFRPSGLILVKK